MAEENDNLIGRPKRVLPESNAVDKDAEAKLAMKRAFAESREQAERIAAERAAKLAKKGVVVVRSLRVRKEHNTISEMVGGLVNGDEVTIHETWTDGKDTWAKIGPDQWAAMVYEGETYIKLAE